MILYTLVLRQKLQWISSSEHFPFILPVGTYKNITRSNESDAICIKYLKNFKRNRNKFSYEQSMRFFPTTLWLCCNCSLDVECDYTILNAIKTKKIRTEIHLINWRIRCISWQECICSFYLYILTIYEKNFYLTTLRVSTHIRKHVYTCMNKHTCMRVA